mmetsp:Transcript_117607/g.374701  ORF Transcript_117607/g.374701 Transcript_117607/m.374701 type:complete len:441 (+) Transcript_117607:114-1436(+)
MRGSIHCQNGARGIRESHAEAGHTEAAAQIQDQGRSRPIWSNNCTVQRLDSLLRGTRSGRGNATATLPRRMPEEPPQRTLREQREDAVFEVPQGARALKAAALPQQHGRAAEEPRAVLRPEARGRAALGELGGRQRGRPLGRALELVCRTLGQQPEELDIVRARQRHRQRDIRVLPTLQHRPRGRCRAQAFQDRCGRAGRRQLHLGIIQRRHRRLQRPACELPNLGSKRVGVLDVDGYGQHHRTTTQKVLHLQVELPPDVLSEAVSQGVVLALPRHVPRAQERRDHQRRIAVKVGNKSPAGSIANERRLDAAGARVFVGKRLDRTRQIRVRVCPGRHERRARRGGVTCDPSAEAAGRGKVLPDRESSDGAQRQGHRARHRPSQDPLGQHRANQQQQQRQQREEREGTAMATGPATSLGHMALGRSRAGTVHAPQLGPKVP